MSRLNWERPDVQPRNRTRIRDIRPSSETKSLAVDYDNVTCVGCHYPIPKGGVMIMSLREGVRVYRHNRCPSLSERRQMRSA